MPPADNGGLRPGGEPVKSFCATDTWVEDSGEEITLLFGADEAERFTRIIMSPFSAKRLSILLRHAVRDYEKEFGFPYGPPAGAPRSAPGSGSDGETAGRGEQGERLIRLIRGLGVPYGFEESVKLLAGRALANRFLIGFKQADLRGDRRTALADLGAAIEMPPACLDRFCERLPEANIVLFAYEENGSASVYKAYLEFGGDFDAAVRRNPREPESCLLHLGFKWNAVQPDAYTMARYVCYPAYSVKTIMEKLACVFYASEQRSSLEIARDIVSLASQRMRPDEFLYTEVTEENNPRRSFDINMYRANLRMHDLSPQLSRLFRYYRIPEEVFRELYERMAPQIFGHLSGGLDREGRDFLTLYHGVKGSSR